MKTPDEILSAIVPEVTRVMTFFLTGVLAFNAPSVQAQEAALDPPAVQNAGADEVGIRSITNPGKSNGVLIGDILSRKVVLEIKPPYRIDKSAFPKKGTKTNGVELVEVKVDAANSNTRYTIELQYQVFANADVPTVMRLPEEKIDLTGGPKALTMTIPAWHFWFSPLVTGGLLVAEKNLQPQFKPPLVDLVPVQTRLAVFLGMLVTGLLGLFYINADSNWLPFMGGAFARAHRQLKRLARTAANKTSVEEKQALVYIHEAFNKVYGANIFARDIDHFLTKRPGFRPLKSEIEQFFNYSNLSLYSTRTRDSAQLIQQLVQLSKQLRDCERGV